MVEASVIILSLFNSFVLVTYLIRFCAFVHDVEHSLSA